MEAQAGAEVGHALMVVIGSCQLQFSCQFSPVRVSIDRAWAFEAFGARQRRDGLRDSIQVRACVTRCTDTSFTKSAAFRPPRKRAAPAVGST